MPVFRSPNTNVLIEGYEVDCVWPEARLIVELDSRTHHAVAHAFEEDRVRDRRLEANGWRVVRITWRQLHDTPGAVEADLRRLLRSPRAANLLPRMISTNQFKNGTHIEVDGTVFKIVEFQHVKPGKGGAFVRTKLKRADDGAVIDKTFRAGEKFRPVRTESRKMTFLYSDGTDAHFMDTQTYEQMAVPEDAWPSRSSGSSQRGGRRPLRRRVAQRHPGPECRGAQRGRDRARRSRRHRHAAAATSPPRSSRA